MYIFSNIDRISLYVKLIISSIQQGELNESSEKGKSPRKKSLHLFIHAWIRLYLNLHFRYFWNELNVSHVEIIKKNFRSGEIKNLQIFFR